MLSLFISPSLFLFHIDLIKLRSLFMLVQVALPQVADYYVRRQTKGIRDQTIAELAECFTSEETGISEVNMLL